MGCIAFNVIICELIQLFCKLIHLYRYIMFFIYLKYIISAHPHKELVIILPFTFIYKAYRVKLL